MWQVYAPAIYQHFAQPLSEEQIIILTQAFSLLLKTQP